jgi:excisionase family DNA binding protein
MEMTQTTKGQTETKELSTKEACRQLGVSMVYMYHLLYEGKLPARKVRGDWRIEAEAVERRARIRREKAAATAAWIGREQQTSGANGTAT